MRRPSSSFASLDSPRASDSVSIDLLTDDDKVWLIDAPQAVVESVEDHINVRPVSVRFFSSPSLIPSPFSSLLNRPPGQQGSNTLVLSRRNLAATRSNSKELLVRSPPSSRSCSLLRTRLTSSSSSSLFSLVPQGQPTPTAFKSHRGCFISTSFERSTSRASRSRELSHWQTRTRERCVASPSFFDEDPSRDAVFSFADPLDCSLLFPSDGYAVLRVDGRGPELRCCCFLFSFARSSILTTLSVHLSPFDRIHLRPRYLIILLHR